MWKFWKLLAIVPIFFFIYQQEATGSPLSDILEIGRGGNRQGRCFGLWDWMWGYSKKQFEEKVISVDPNNVRFFFYPDPYNPDKFQEIVYGDVRSLQQAQYRFGQPWKILIHGYTMSQNASFPQNVKNGYMEEYRNRLRRDSNTDGFNVVLVDWGPLADPKLTGNFNFFLLYVFAVRNVQVVGNRVGEFVTFLKDNGALESFNNMHIIGFSLGAHVAGNAGTTVLNITGQRVARVTGLDPAGPNFYMGLKGISSPKLSKNAGKFVDVIHSNQGAFGTMETMGHADFWPNGGGPVQKFCVAQYAKTKDNNESFVIDVGSCSHNRAPAFYAKSISSAGEIMSACLCENYKLYKSGCDCSTKSYFGEYCDNTARGNFYLDITD